MSFKKKKLQIFRIGRFQHSLTLFFIIILFYISRITSQRNLKKNITKLAPFGELYSFIEQ